MYIFVYAFGTTFILYSLSKTITLYFMPMRFILTLITR